LLTGLVWKLDGFGFPFGVLLPLGVVGLVLERRRIPAPVWLFLGLYPLAVVLIFVSARYRVPIVPVLAPPAVLGAAALIDRCRSGRWKRAASAVGLAVAVGIAGTLPGPFCLERANWNAALYAAVGHTQLSRGNLPEAEANFNQALAHENELAQALVELGEVRLEQGRSAGLVRTRGPHGSAVPRAARALRRCTPRPGARR
jgi:hypothetical protein